MLVWMAQRSVGLRLSEEEKEKVLPLLPPGGAFTIVWSNRGRTLALRPALDREARSSLFREKETRTATPTARWSLQWHRSSLPEGGRWPFFGTCPAERVTYHEGSVEITVLPEEQRPAVRKFNKRPRTGPRPENNSGSYAAPVAAPVTPVAPAPAATVRVIDTLEQLRSYVKKLNEVRDRHPENVTFKVKPDGRLGFEFLADE